MLHVFFLPSSLPNMAKEIDRELLPFIRIYKDGTVERLSGTPFVPSSPAGDPATGTLSTDVTISHSPPLAARLYLPAATPPRRKLPVLLYCHGGAFCIESAFCLVESKFLNNLVSKSRVLAVAVDYRLAPEHPVPLQYSDCFAALRWLASHRHGGGSEQWIRDHADWERLYVGGDSSGANLALSVVLRAGAEGLPYGVRVLGTYLTHPYFWGSEAVGEEETEAREEIMAYKIWNFFYPEAEGGIDNPAMNPAAASLATMAGSRLLVTVAEGDLLRSRGVWFCEEVRKSGWKGEVEFVEVEGENHAFHIINYESEAADKFIARLASFLK